MRVLLVYPEFPDTFWSFRHALRFVRRRASSPPLGLLTVAALLPPDWDLRLIDMNVQRLSDQDLAWAECVFISAMAVQRPAIGLLIARCRNAGLRVIAGGPLFLYEHEAFPEVDHFVLGEAEEVAARLAADLTAGRARRIYRAPDFTDLRRSPRPRWDLVDMRPYDSMSVQFSRGWPPPV